VFEHKVKVGEVEGPPSLPQVQLFGHHEVFQVLVIRPDLAFVFRTFNEVPPLLERSDDCQHFLVVDLVVPFDRS